VDYYGAADVFVLPTISDGFAITQLEAMAHGLPVIATSHCGEVVTHGEDGLIIPAFSGSALAEAILELERNRERVAEMSRRAVAKSRQFDLGRLAESLCRIVDMHA
jgi:glycosyltransferase involved in cell wall biosynthesis